MPAGTYTVEITAVDENGCETVANASADVTEPDAIEISGVVTDVLCNGATTGAIAITVTGGNGGNTFGWTGTGVTTSTEDQTGLGAGSYTVTVTDSKGCTADMTFEITEPTPLAIQVVSQTDVDCNGASTGGVVVDATGGTSGYTYTLSLIHI